MTTIPSNAAMMIQIYFPLAGVKSQVTVYSLRNMKVTWEFILFNISKYMYMYVSKACVIDNT